MTSLLLFALSGIFHYVVGSVDCNTGNGHIETNKDLNHTFDLPEVNEIIFGFKVSVYEASIRVSLSTAEIKGKSQSITYYGKGDEWLFFRITQDDYRIPLDKTISLKTMNITLAGRKFTVSSTYSVCWRMFLPDGNVECETLPPTSEQPEYSTPEHHRNDTFCEILPKSEDGSTNTIILIVAVGGLLVLSWVLSSGLICYVHLLKKQVKRMQEEHQAIIMNPANQRPDLNTRNATGTVSDSTSGRPNSAHESENSIYGVIVR
ncbi:uncharacterized protein [Macrobrachium rosenbergii]|uniref:uncharacterized protein n=1 Tax=Macrobrachium rosenbergii TaxID=79674 RepID=UPI0034D46399